MRWLPLFAMGMGAFRLFQRLSTWQSFAFVEGAAVCAAAVMGRPIGVVGGIIAAFFLALCTPRISPLITAYAAMTYSLYLVHEPLCIRAVHLVQRLGDGPGVLCAAMAAGVAISLLGAYVFWWLVEKPSLRLATKLKRARLPRDVQ
jgi:peptidoglycan/LPS O-acetylase OafA/YrhL